MAVVSLFRDTNMAAVTSRENTLYYLQVSNVTSWNNYLKHFARQMKITESHFLSIHGVSYDPSKRPESLPKQ